MRTVSAELGATYFGVASVVIIGSEQWSHIAAYRVPVFVTFGQYGPDLMAFIMPTDGTSGKTITLSEVTTVGFLTSGQVWKLTSA